LQGGKKKARVFYLKVLKLY